MPGDYPKYWQGEGGYRAPGLDQGEPIYYNNPSPPPSPIAPKPKPDFTQTKYPAKSAIKFYGGESFPVRSVSKEAAGENEASESVKITNDTPFGAVGNDRSYTRITKSPSLQNAVVPEPVQVDDVSDSSTDGSNDDQWNSFSFGVVSDTITYHDPYEGREGDFARKTHAMKKIERMMGNGYSAKERAGEPSPPSRVRRGLYKRTYEPFSPSIEESSSETQHAVSKSRKRVENDIVVEVIAPNEDPDALFYPSYFEPVADEAFLTNYGYDRRLYSIPTLRRIEAFERSAVAAGTFDPSPDNPFTPRLRLVIHDGIDDDDCGCEEDDVDEVDCGCEEVGDDLFDFDEEDFCDDEVVIYDDEDDFYLDEANDFYDDEDDFYDRDEEDFYDRDERTFNDFNNFGDRRFSDRSYTDRSYGDRSYGDRGFTVRGYDRGDDFFGRGFNFGNVGFFNGPDFGPFLAKRDWPQHIQEKASKMMNNAKEMQEKGQVVMDNDPKYQESLKEKEMQKEREMAAQASPADSNPAPPQVSKAAPAANKKAFPGGTGRGGNLPPAPQANQPAGEMRVKQPMQPNNPGQPRQPEHKQPEHKQPAHPNHGQQQPRPQRQAQPQQPKKQPQQGNFPQQGFPQKYGKAGKGFKKAAPPKLQRRDTIIPAGYVLITDYHP